MSGKGVIGKHAISAADGPNRHFSAVQSSQETPIVSAVKRIRKEGFDDGWNRGFLDGLICSGCLFLAGLVLYLMFR